MRSTSRSCAPGWRARAARRFSLEHKDQKLKSRAQTRQLADLRKRGKVRYIGVSNFDVNQMSRVQSFAPITSLQSPYSLFNRGSKPEILSYCNQHTIEVIIYSPMDRVC